MITPLKSIRAHCVACMGGSYKAVTECPATNCPLNPDRSGNKRLSQRPLSAIRAFCLGCVGGSPDEVKACTGRMLFSSACPLQPYRLGENPKKWGQGQAKNLFKLPNGKGVNGPESHNPAQEVVGHGAA